MSLILPGTLEFVLACEELPPPPGWRQEAHRKSGEIAFIAPLGSSGLLEAVPLARAWEYAYDGELDARQNELDEIYGEEEGVLVTDGDDYA